VIFLNGTETLEPIDSSGDHSTLAVNGGPPQPIPEPQFAMFAYRCHGSTFTTSDTYGDRYLYQRVSTKP
jgi:hypothetical protein